MACPSILFFLVLGGLASVLAAPAEAGCALDLAPELLNAPPHLRVGGLPQPLQEILVPLVLSDEALHVALHFVLYKPASIDFLLQLLDLLVLLLDQLIFF